MGVLKRPRIVVVAVIILCLMYSTSNEHQQPVVKPKWDFKPPPGWPQNADTATPINQILASDDHVVAEKPLTENAVPATRPPMPPGFHEEAHKLAKADDFFFHFAAVRKLPGLTMAAAKSTCDWPFGQVVNYQFGIDGDWVNNLRSDTEIEWRRQEWQQYVERDMIPYSQVEGRFSGRGLVICAGNQDTLMRVKVILRALLKLQSQVAIEIHYFGNEMSESSKKELSDMYPNMFFNDLSGAHNILQAKQDHFWINYQLKTAAVINSRFAEPFLLDSDNIPILDPATLYDSAVYAEYGSVFWPDIARTRAQNPAWAITNTPCRMDEYELESGQLMVDKRRFWYHLQLAAWMNNERGPYYNEFLLGDKDMFRFAWHALKTKYGKPRKWLTSVGTENEGYYCGHSFAQHHPDDGRVAFLHGGLVKTVDLDVMRWNREVKGAYFRHYKRAPTDEDPAVSVNVGIKFDGAEYMPNHGPDFHWAQCTDMYDVEAQDMNELVFGFESTFREIGGYWQLDSAGNGQGQEASG